MPEQPAAPAFRVVPVTRSEAVAFVARRHRGHVPKNCPVRVGVTHDGALVGVALAGRPYARVTRNPHTLDVRAIAADWEPAGAFAATAAAVTALALAQGYTRLILPSARAETLPELHSAGWSQDGGVRMVVDPSQPAARTLAPRWWWTHESHLAAPEA